MHDLLKAEWLRFRTLAIASAVLHLLVIGFLTRLVDLAQQPVMVYQLFGAAYVLTGLLLGLYQMGAYRRPNSWLNLLHRPLSQSQIAGALLGAGGLSLLVAVVLPIVVIAGWQDGLSSRVFDLRHWLLPLAGWIVAACGYLIGCYCMLAGGRLAAAALVFLLLLANAQASGVAVVALQLLILAWLLLMVLGAFKPDLSAGPQSAAAMSLVAIPMQMVMFSLIVLLGVVAEIAWIAQGSHPINVPTPPRGSVVELTRMEAQERLLAGLESSTVVETDLLVQQVELSEAILLSPNVASAALAHQMSAEAPFDLQDHERHLKWVFSHDSMRFEGINPVDQSPLPSMGIGVDNAAFPAPALAAGRLPIMAGGDAVVVAGGTIYQYLSETGLILPRFELPDGELVTGMQLIGQSFGVMSNRALYFFNGRDAAEDYEHLSPRIRLQIPAAYDDLDYIDLVELVDGYLVSFSALSYGKDAYAATPYQTIIRVDGTGLSETLVHRELPYAFPELFRYRHWLPSPVVSELAGRAKFLFAAPNPNTASVRAPVPARMLWLAATLNLLSVVGALWLMRRRSLSFGNRAVWVLACAVIGMPALMSFWLLFPLPEMLEGHAPPTPAVAT